MKVLLVHPDDSPLDGPWSRTRWDSIVDLGWAGSQVYARWSAETGCPVRSLYDLAQEVQDIHRIKDYLAVGLHQLVDEEGLDWWEILAPLRYPQMFERLLIVRLSREIAADEVAATSSHRLLPLLSSVLEQEVQCFVSQ